MFCKWCGKKISNNGVPCPSCGRNQDALESGNGFWDLCSMKPENTTSILETDVVFAQEKEAGKPKTPKEKDFKKAADNKRSKVCFSLLQIATNCLILIAIIAVGISVNKTEDCLSELNTVRSEISILSEFVDGGFEEIEEYHTYAFPSVDDQFIKDTEGADENTELSIDELLESNEVLLLRTYKLHIESYEIESEPAYTLYIASGDLLAENSSKIYWQKSIDAGETWQTLTEDSPYLVEYLCEDAIYRLLYLMDSDTAVKPVCYYAVPAKPDVNSEAGEDKTLPATEFFTEETTSAQEEEPIDENVPESTEAVSDDSIPSNDSEYSVGS